MANLGAIIVACQSRRAVAAAAIAGEEQSMSDGLLQVPLDRLKAERPQAVAAVLRRIADRDETPARAQAAQFNSSI